MDHEIGLQVDRRTLGSDASQQYLMPPTQASRRAVFQQLSHPLHAWPAYDDTPLYDRASLNALKEDVRTVATAWFNHDHHESVDQFAGYLPLAYVRFDPHDRYSTSTTYEMEQLVRLFLVKELHGWQHETAVRTYLEDSPNLQLLLGFETLPDQATLWRSWHHRFTPDLRSTIESAAETILRQATHNDCPVPRQPSTSHSRHRDDEDAPPTDQEILARADAITEQVSHTAYPAFSLDRGNGCEIHEHAFWDLQTYLGLRGQLAANEGARSFLFESTRDRTPMGHIHRQHLRNLSISEIREMYRQAIQRLISRAADTSAFHRAGIVAIDTTEADPFTGDRTGHEDEIIGTKEKTDEYAYQWATIQLVGNAVPIVLDARPVKKGDARLEIVKDLLDSAEDLVHVDNVLMDREFDSQHILEELSRRNLAYVVPKRMQTSEKAQAKRLLRRDQDRYVTDRKLHLGHNEWQDTTLIYRRNENSEHTDHRQYSVFMSNRGDTFLNEYTHRWEIESGYKSIKRFMAATTSKNFVLRFFYFAFACLLYSIWRTVDLLVQIDLTGEYDGSPMVTAENTLTLLRKETGIG